MWVRREIGRRRKLGLAEVGFSREGKVVDM